MATSRSHTKLGGYVQPPNGDKVTQAMLYQALYDLDQGLGKRFTSIADSINLISEAIQNHMKDGHPFTDRAAVVKEEIKLDTRKAAVVAALLGVGTVSLTLITEVLRRALPL